MSKKLDWPLADSPFTFLDKLKIAWWIMSQDRYTMGAKVAELEQKFSDLSGSQALMVANGSIANHLVFELWKIKNPGIKPVVIVPAVTWSSSITPAMMAGMDIVFCDINLNDFCFDYKKLETILQEQLELDRRIIIWPTALIGWSPNMVLLEKLAEQYRADLFLDACENTLAQIRAQNNCDISILQSARIVTTSCYLSHYVCSVEGGFVFFKDSNDYELAKMFRNHGMSRSLADNNRLRVEIESNNSTVDPLFLFAVAGSNFRNSDVHAMFGLVDFERINKMTEHRIVIYNSFYHGLDFDKYYLPEKTIYHVPFCLPIFRKDDQISLVKHRLKNLGIETRPIIGANLLRQPCFSRFGNPIDFPNAEWLHHHGCYVGLYHKVNKKMVEYLVEKLNSI